MRPRLHLTPEYYEDIQEVSSHMCARGSYHYDFGTEPEGTQILWLCNGPDKREGIPCAHKTEGAALRCIDDRHTY